MYKPFELSNKKVTKARPLPLFVSDEGRNEPLNTRLTIALNHVLLFLFKWLDANRTQDLSNACMDQEWDVMADRECLNFTSSCPGFDSSYHW